MVPRLFSQGFAPIYTVFLPEIVKPKEGVNVTISIKPERKYITINQKDGILAIARDLIPQDKTNEILEIILTDSIGHETISKLEIQFEQRHEDKDER